MTEGLLKQSQSQAEELRSQQEELRESNEDLGRQAQLLAEQNIEVGDRRTSEIEQSKRLVEEKAGQLAVSSKYKSEFIANMSHELRTPLNSLLILAQQLEDNPDSNMTDTQVQYASVIRASGNDLLDLLNGILDLAKVESGTVTVELAECQPRPTARRSAARLRTHRPHQGSRLRHRAWPPGRPGSIITDPQRLRQILKNLLANAFKFTERGEVQVRVWLATEGWTQEGGPLDAASSVLAFSVSDTGIGIEAESAATDLRGFRPRRRHYRSYLWRDGPGPLHQPRTGRPPGRRDHAGQRAGPRQHLHGLPAAGPDFPAHPRSVRPDVRGRRHARCGRRVRGPAGPPTLLPPRARLTSWATTPWRERTSSWSTTTSATYSP